MAELSTSDYIIFQSPYLLGLSFSLVTSKRRFGPKATMKRIPNNGKATVKFLSLPKPVETTFDTGHGPNNNLKWEMDIDLIEHPEQEAGKMVWQTTAIVIRLEIYGLVLDCGDKTPPLNELLKDLGSSNWEIQVDERGVINLQEI
jgi:hypothetical protein